MCKDTGTLNNEQSVNVEAGDVYFVEPYQMHALENSSDNENLILMNIAPASHLSFIHKYIRNKLSTNVNG